MNEKILTEQLLALAQEPQPAHCTTARRQVCWALDGIIAASRTSNDLDTWTAARYLRGRITTLLHPTGKRADFDQLVQVVLRIRQGLRLHLNAAAATCPIEHDPICCQVAAAIAAWDTRRQRPVA